MFVIVQCNRFGVTVLLGTAVLFSGISAAAAADLVLVDAGKARSVIVTAGEPSPVAAYAAGELVAHIEKATGVRLEVLREADLRTGDPRVPVRIGATAAAKQAGLAPDAFPGETYRIKAIGGSLFILGREDGKDLFAAEPMRWQDRFVRETRRGTLYGVVDFLERILGVRWLWPGDLGTYVPRRTTLTVVADMDISGGPAFKFRHYRIQGITNATVPEIAEKNANSAAGRVGFTTEWLQRYDEALRRYLLIHQEGDTEPQPRVGHRFQGWWRKYGKEHPEWFTMSDEGVRGPAPGNPNTYQVRMCVSNPELQRFIVEHEWDGGDLLSLGEADHRGFCRCPACKTWDEPQPTDFKWYSTTNRYVRFAQAVHALAVKRNPNVKILMFLYMDYTHAPTIDADLSWMYGEFVPWGSGYPSMYPVTEAQFADIKRAWLGWSETGMEMCYRPNYLLGGYVVPQVSMRQTGEMIRFAAQHGMIGFDYDSLWGQWATKGPMLYVHMRLGTDPSRKVADVLDEYYAAFGPAADKVTAYFEYWENYASTKAPGNALNWSDCSDVGKLYPPEAFAPAAGLLTEALENAQASQLPEFADRVRFLRAGLEHAELATRFSNLYGAQQFAEARKVLLELVDFRRAHENGFIADYVAAARVESKAYPELNALLDGDLPTPKQTRPELEIGMGWSTPWATWYFRKDLENKGLAPAEFSPESFDPEGWTKVEVPAYLSQTAAGPYNGYGWYAVTFDVPEDWFGHDIELLFEGVDKQAWVYVNGNKVYEHTIEATGMTVQELWATPFIARVPAAHVKAGQENLLVVCVHSGFMDSGLYKPVRLREAGEQ